MFRRQRHADDSTAPLFEPLEPRLMLSAGPITFTDAGGTEVVIRLGGNGSVELIETDGQYSLELTGTDQKSNLRIQTRGGDGRATLHDISISGAIRSINGRTVDITGDVSIAGSVTTLNLGDFTSEQQQALTIGGTAIAKPGNINLGHVNNLSLLSGTPIRALRVVEWTDPDHNDTITAPMIRQVNARGDFAAGARLANTDFDGMLLRQVNVRGELGGTWHIDQEAGKITAGSVGETFSMNVTGPLRSLTSRGDFAGVLATTDIRAVSIRGDMTDAVILAGADLGDDAQLGGTGADRDLFFTGSIRKVTIRGNVTSSVIGVGLDPVNGVFGDGDDVVIGRDRSLLRSLTVRGSADANSLFAAGSFGNNRRVAGTRIDPAGDPRFLLASTAPDVDAPTITVELQNILGEQDGIPITNNPVITGRVTDLGRVTFFRVGVDDDRLNHFTNILGRLEANGTFVLTRSQIESVNGGPLTLGLHEVNFVARDDAGNTTAFIPVRFILVP